MLLRMFRRALPGEPGLASLSSRFKAFFPGYDLANLSLETCFYIETSAPLSGDDETKLRWLLTETFDPAGLSDRPFVTGDSYPTIIEIGPRLNFETAWSSIAVSICHHAGLVQVTRLERSRRVGLTFKLVGSQLEQFIAALHDRMTEMPYGDNGLISFDSGLSPEPVLVIPLMREGIGALRRVNKEYGLAMDESDLNYYYNLFVNRLNRDPTIVELFWLGQANSEHSRHHIFRGELMLDGKMLGLSLMDIVREPHHVNPNNSIIAFHDDSSAIRGYSIATLIPAHPGQVAEFLLGHMFFNPTLTAETHNFPTGIAPYPGAATGTGGRIRDNQCVGRGGLIVASGVGICVGNLHIPGYELPWEADGHLHPANLASPLEILIEGRNGAWGYGNCFGEPVILGHVRSVGLPTRDGYRAYFKPILYTEGVGMIDDRHVEKGKPEKGMWLTQFGGPAFDIGNGGGSASSQPSGDNSSDLDFNAVQRGDPEMAQRVNRVIRACSELGEENPIVSAHDLGAGGDCNALPEIIDPVGGIINLRSIPVGDRSLSVLKIWGNESQERNVALIRPQDFERFKAICDREGVSCVVVGEVTGDGWLRVFDEQDNSWPAQLPLAPILGNIPCKTIPLEEVPTQLFPLELPAGLTVRQALDLVLRLLSVASKGWLTRHVDRSVTGLVAQQQCVGPNQLPLSDYAVVAHSVLGNTGTALSQGERPLIGLIDPAAQARMAVGESLTNLMGAKISSIEDIRCSANWMWPAKSPGEIMRMYRAAVAMAGMMIKIGMAVDGGKDSMSMAAKTPAGVVKAPGQLVIANYVTMPDVTKKVTPDLKTEDGWLLFVDLSLADQPHKPLGGSALAQVYQQLGDECPNVRSVRLLVYLFNAVQRLIERGQIASLHDRSDGGLIVTLLEMAFAGNRGVDIDITNCSDPLSYFFNEELGIVLECTDPQVVEEALEAAEIRCTRIGRVNGQHGPILVRYNNECIIHEPLGELRAIWEETSSRLDAQNANPECVEEEALLVVAPIDPPSWRLSFTPQPTSSLPCGPKQPQMAVIRATGTNGDREMAAAFLAAGFRVYDVTMSDLLTGAFTLDQIQCIAFAGGFADGDVLDSAKGWAGTIRFNPELAAQFEAFRQRPDTLSLGVCNGCQLMALLGWVSPPDLLDEERPRFIHNLSGVFESRFCHVAIPESSAIMFREMAGSRLGIWVAHGEGRLHLPSAKFNADRILNLDKVCPMVYATPGGRLWTETYPFNPNGSPAGIAALCSQDGRHVAMMPHPERSANAMWQWPWMPEEWKEFTVSPWLKLFQNAYDWCRQQ